MKAGKLEPGDVIKPWWGEAREVVSVWSGKEIVIPYPEQTAMSLDERSALCVGERGPVLARSRFVVKGL